MKKRKWVPLMIYENNQVQHCVFAKLRRSGLVSFKVRRMTGIFHCAYVAPSVDIQKQWNKLFEEVV